MLRSFRLYSSLTLVIQKTQCHMLAAISVGSSIILGHWYLDNLLFSICTFKTCGSAPKLILAIELERRWISCSLTSPSETSVRPVNISLLWTQLQKHSLQREMVMKPCKHQRSKQECHDLCYWKVQDHAQSFVLSINVLYAWTTQSQCLYLLVPWYGENKSIVFCARSGPKKRTKTYNKGMCCVHNYSLLLTMTDISDCSKSKNSKQISSFRWKPINNGVNSGLISWIFHIKLNVLNL